MPTFALSYDEIEAFFTELDIPTDTVGFFDHPNFLAEERQDAYFLCRYANFVRAKPRNAAYDTYALQTVPIIAKHLHNELVAEGRQGACVDMSMVLQRILDAEGIWSYLTIGGLFLSFPSHRRLQEVFFYPIDQQDLPGHSWVSAPPFDVIDITVGQQNYFQPRARNHLPNIVLLDSINPIEPASEELCSPEIRMQATLQGIDIWDFIDQIRPDLEDIFPAFPANGQRIQGVMMRYVPTGIRVSEGTLPKINNQSWNSRFGREIYEDLIRPALAEVR